MFLVTSLRLLGTLKSLGQTFVDDVSYFIWTFRKLSNILLYLYPYRQETRNLNSKIEMFYRQQR